MCNINLCNFEVLERYGNFLDKGIITKSLFENILYESIDEIDDGLYEYFYKYAKNNDTCNRLFNIVPEILHMYKTKESDTPQLISYRFFDR